MTDTRGHILAVDESDELLELFRELLQDEGYRVTTQPHVDKSIEVVSELNPDLIILDYMWASDDSGWAYLQMLKMSPLTTHIPVIVCTGAIKRVEELKAHLDEMGVLVIFKPFNLDTLLDAVSSALNAECESPHRESDPASAS